MARPPLAALAQRLGLETGVALDQDGRPVLNAQDDEQLSCSYAGVELVVGDPGSSAGRGTAFVTTRRVVWVADGAASGSTDSSSTSTSSLACSYRQISMHAVSRDAAAFSKPCVYLQLDEGSEAMGDDEDEAEEGEEEEPSAELRLVPADESQVEAMFSALCEASALNPDSDMEEEAGAQLFFDEDEVLAGLPEEQRAAVLAARAEGLDLQAGDELDELVGEDPGRFEDDEEGDEEGQQTGQQPAVGNGVA